LTGRTGGFEQPFAGGLNKGLGAASRNLRSMDQLDRSLSNKSGGSADIKVGYNVMHDRFGKGKVTKLEGDGPDKKATIFFPHHGAKTVLLRFANLTVLED
jgi:DNA helicase-2/ATP-dependent DNA helicase PcrA